MSARINVRESAPRVISGVYFCCSWFGSDTRLRFGRTIIWRKRIRWNIPTFLFYYHFNWKYKVPKTFNIPTIWVIIDLLSVYSMDYDLSVKNPKTVIKYLAGFIRHGFKSYLYIIHFIYTYIRMSTKNKITFSHSVECFV